MRLEPLPCADCGHDTRAMGEYYMVHGVIWEYAVYMRPRPSEAAKFLCIGCLEARIGRTLLARDFTDAPVNWEAPRLRSLRLRHRLRNYPNGKLIRSAAE